MTSTEPAPAERRHSLYNAGYWLLVTVALAFAVHVHQVASLTLPAPSGDEALFVWQSHAFERWFSFVAPELDPHRPILLLPFAYQVVVGLVFKVTGCSIENARYVSLAFYLAGFAVLAAVARRQSSPYMAFLLVAAFLLNRDFVFMGNSVRMEPMLFLVLGVSLLLFQRGQAWTALALLAAAPMIHPNAVLYLVPAAIYAWITGGIRRERPGRLAIALFVVAAAIWLAHAIYVLRYWDAFVYNTAHRFGETATGTAKNALSQIGGAKNFALAFIGFAILGVSAWRRIGAGILVVFALGAWLHSHLRLEEPYYAFADLVYLFLSLALMEVSAKVAASLPAPALRRLAPFAAPVAAVVLLGFHLRMRFIDSPVNYFGELRFSGMRIAPPGSYFNAADKQALQDYLKTQRPGQPLMVEVYPWSDALLMADMSDARVHYQVPYFDAVVRPADQWVWGYGPTETPPPDVYLVRVSRYTPPHLQSRPEAMIARARKHAKPGEPKVVHSRDGTEIWYALEVAPRAE